MGVHYLSELHQTSLCSFLQRLVSFIYTLLYGNNQTTITSEISELSSLENVQHTDSTVPLACVSNCYSQLQEYYETLITLTKDIQKLSENSVRLSTESLRLQHLEQACQKVINQVKQSITECDSYIVGITQNYEVLQQEVSSMKQKLEDLQSISYDGILTWKIDNVSEKMADAQSERQTSIYSPPFYSSPTGYRMRIRLYLHGDGNARRTHMSLFFLIMRGEYDAILRWPFNFKVTFCLYDQSGQNRHIIDSFRPDTKSNSFQRPRSEMNIASGIPKFFPLPMILQDNNNYIKDDTMFIKCLVDFGDISKIILPYALSLNPALPHYVQRNLIHAETERRLQSQQQSTVPATNNNSQVFVNQINNDNTLMALDNINCQSLPLESKQNILVMDSDQITNSLQHQQNHTSTLLRKPSPPSKKKKMSSSSTDESKDDTMNE
ncbi:unnamed protein product [Didymodactylos carnosus]|uniref:MATH domain-containing protein n=1 Tax=Didymodactylos carnosus TaxID=1234261 RepID=A0A814SBV9_9BILA|nr:unnamed protein product [Didymodactylos carnosus]CAF1146008.1 unnamed protein product [Didymodactylos carnosus]CAF3811768.1 unnamed protein product [Didymodactylos carnosus]CAF3909603.1 unnamed protein product [Didymodactylos carnosus]